MTIKIEYIKETGLLFAVETKHGKSMKANLELRKFKISRKVEAEFARGFIALYGATALGGIGIAMRSLRRLLESVSNEAESSIEVFPVDTLQRYIASIKMLKLGNSAFLSSIHAPKKILNWLQRNGTCVPARLDFIVEDLPQVDEKGEREKLSEDDLKKIIELCFELIEKLEERLGRLTPIMGQDDSPEGVATSKILNLGKGKFVKYSELRKIGVSGKLFEQINGVGGYKYLVARTKFNISDVFVFYLALLCLTGGNPEGFMYMTSEDIMPHPMRKDLERVYWGKERAGREQYQDFPAKKQWSAPELIRRCLKLNADIRNQEDCTQPNMVFVCWTQVGAPRVPSRQSLHNCLDDFIKENRLPNFDFKDLRVINAKIHHKAGGSILAAKRKLNHKQVSTTEIYTPLSDVSNLHDAKIYRYQGSFLNENSSGLDVLKVSGQSTSSGVAQSIFGFGCKDPLSGIAPSSQPGVLCLQFTQCATCPGAIVPVDDIEVVSRLLAAEKKLTLTLEKARSEGWLSRFKTLYEPTLRILRDQILPKVPDLAKELATQRSQFILFPAID
ncbi:MAG: hypothetical protein RSD57_10800 [Comamonas sp.]